MSTLVQDQRLGSYRIVRLLGEGGMGAVYEARHEALGRRVALKTLLPEHARDEQAVARFFNEAKVLSRMEHPCIVQASDFGQAPDGTAYLVMEYLRGHSLARRLRTLKEAEERLPVATVLQIAWQVADVLALAHAQGIVHRDLKPDNLMLVADPIAPGGERVKVLDFGIAKLTEAAEGGVKTNTLAVLGTPMYMSPEQCQGAGGVDGKSDVYSLGCVLYEMFAGHPPFVNGGALQILGQHIFQPPQPLASLAPRVPPAICELVHRLLTKDKAERPNISDTADELGQILCKISGGSSAVRSRLQSSTDPSGSFTPQAIKVSTTMGQSNGQANSSLRRQLPLAVAGATVLVLGVILTVWWLRTPPKPTSTATQPPVVRVPVVAAASPAPALPTVPPPAATIEASESAKMPAPISISPKMVAQPRPARMAAANKKSPPLPEPKTSLPPPSPPKAPDPEPTPPPIRPKAPDPEPAPPPPARSKKSVDRED